MPREQAILKDPQKSCHTNLFFGFFFDGTKNNYVGAESSKTHSNIVRLYDCFPGMSVPGVLPKEMDWQYKPSNYNHFFKVYIPGVASAFKEVGDTGQGLDLTLGAAMGYKGEARIIWALIQAINNVHRYFTSKPLIEAADVPKLLKAIDLHKNQRTAMDPFFYTDPDRGADKQIRTRGVFQEWLTKLHKAVSLHWKNGAQDPPKKDPGIVDTIYISIFGFSRGATQARAFTNWLQALCTFDASLCGKSGMTLGGFPVAFNFLGLFDTVASVGAGNTFGNNVLAKLADGHGAWSDSESSLRIPAGLRCVHLVAAQEVRRSFPLDSISVNGLLPDNCDEIVIPGMHSDIGCGYMPTEQGKGVDPDGDDMLSRIPLIYMYREARLAGVPLKLELANPIARQRFALTPQTISDFNAYIATCKITEGTLTAIMRDQRKYYIQWLLYRRASGKTPLTGSASFQRAVNFDQNDLKSANLEFEDEIKAFDSWMADKGKKHPFQAMAPGFDNEHANEWEEIATWWNSAAPLPPQVIHFFDEYVHDSRAWFKLIPGNPDSEADMHVKLQKMVEIRQRTLKENQERPRIAPLTERGAQASAAVSDGLTDEERAAADEYARTLKIPLMNTKGREPFTGAKAGYLRYRKIYAGADGILISTTPELIRTDKAHHTA
ncbi:T6SS phospholipase effector Tle1-like catalytic domain-containing protein [Janthinobacterium agaricidamnosum]|nr:DUF2235 domain-containing protein [Janthinobacterium agaricidamnosum]